MENPAIPTPVVQTQPVQLIECPRDAMQGWSSVIPTATKAAYLNVLLQVGFDTLDFGSFVSPKIIPQMADTAEVLSLLQPNPSRTRLLAIVANERGARAALAHDAIDCLGFPFSVSDTFQRRNTGKSIAESLPVVEAIYNRCAAAGKELVLYLSMGFGNPYGDPYTETIVEQWTAAFVQRGIRTLSLSDTAGVADPETIRRLFAHLIPAYPEVTFGAHFHSTPATRMEKIAAAYENGCRRFDGAIQGVGGCPMAQDRLVGNMATETLLAYFEGVHQPVQYNPAAWTEALQMAAAIFG